MILPALAGQLFRSVFIFHYRVNISIFRELYGAGYKIRTRDPLITNQVLYQLS